MEENKMTIKENDKLYSKQKDGTITRWYVYAVSGDDFAVSPVPNAKFHHYKRYYKKSDIGVSIFLTRPEAKQSKGRCYAQHENNYA